LTAAKWVFSAGMGNFFQLVAQFAGESIS